MDHLAGFLFLAMSILLMLGFPVAFTLLGTSFVFGLIGFGLDFFNLLPLRVWGVMSNATLVAVPLFIFMGMMLERSGIAGELIEAMGLLFGRLRGGLAITVVAVGALLGACTGIVGASVVTLGLLALKPMREGKYPDHVSTGVIASAGTLGQIIPPSIVLVLLGSVMDISVGDLFLAAVLPGMLLVSVYVAYLLVMGRMRPEWLPTGDEQADFKKDVIPKVIKGLVPPLLLILTVLGSIFAGIATPTEAAGVGAAGATLLCMIKKRFHMEMLRHVMESTTRLTSMVFIILVGAAAFGLVFRGLGGDNLVRELVAHLPFGKYGVLAVIMLGVFILGFFLDIIEITFIHIPVLAPIMAQYGFDPVWIAILFALNLQTSFLTPPVGFALFYLKGVLPPGVSTASIYRGVVPYVVLQLIILLLVATFPGIATWLPRFVYG